MIRAIALFLIVAGIAMGAFGIWFIGTSTEARSWPAVEGRVLSTTVKVSIMQTPRSTGKARENPREYYPVIRYSWIVDGIEYTGERYRLGTTHEKYKKREQAQAAAARFAVGSPITVYYDPADPGEAVLETAISPAVYVPLILGLVFLGTGGLLWRYRQAVTAAIASGKAEPVDPL